MMSIPITTMSAKSMRRTLIRLAKKNVRAGSGSATSFLMERTCTLRFPVVTPILESIPWAAVGAAATRLYMPERMTNDLDILIRRLDAAEARTRLKLSGATVQSTGGTSWLLADGFPLDVFESDEEWVEQAIVEAQVNRDAQQIPVLPLHYLVLMKFRASRAQDLADITRMLGQATADQLGQVRAVFTRWLPDEHEDLDSLIGLGQMELQADSPAAGLRL